MPRRESKRGVTFKTGLIADKEVLEEYKGALMSFDEVSLIAAAINIYRRPTLSASERYISQALFY